MFVDVPGERGDYLLEASSSDNSRLQVSKLESRNLDPGTVTRGSSNTPTVTLRKRTFLVGTDFGLTSS